MRIDMFIKGEPYPKHKSTGDKKAPKRWSDAIQTQTARTRKVRGPCRLDVEFVLPAGRFPRHQRFGTDLDNLLKRLLDSLKETVLSEAPGGDGAIVELRASKIKAEGKQPTGARIIITDQPWNWAMGPNE